jgi:hypothetical protein
MRNFGPSLLAISAGLAWVLVTAGLNPASEEDTPTSAARINNATPAVCSPATLLARIPEVQEASGVAASHRSQDILWTHNDSGQPLLYAVGVDGKLRARVQVTGAQVDDWEDIAVSRCPQGSCVYIADIGDNKRSRRTITIYRVPEPTTADSATAPAEVFTASYPDGPHDAEGFMVSPEGVLYVVTKGEGSPISVYRFPESLASGSVMQLQRLATLSGNVRKDLRITDADFSPDGKWIALRTLDSVEFYRADALLNGAPGSPLVADLRSLGEPQGEGIGFAPDGTVYLAGEAGNSTRGGTLARLSCKLP